MVDITDTTIRYPAISVTKFKYCIQSSENTTVADIQRQLFQTNNCIWETDYTACIMHLTGICNQSCQAPLYGDHNRLMLNTMMTSSNGNIFRVTGHLCGEFAAQRPVTRSFHVFFDLRLYIPLSKQSWGWWFETLLHPLWRHCNAFLETLQCRMRLCSHSRLTRDFLCDHRVAPGQGFNSHAHGCVIITVVTAALVLKHQATRIHSFDWVFTE